jgi:creatinine amidohydrolase/Fe(II)-dependent formamide hydrolase-like protein
MWKEAMLKKEDALGSQSTPTLATYTEAMDKFTKSATAFMQHVHLLTDARDAYQEAVSASSAIRRSLDTGDQSLKALMTQLAQVVNSHFGEPDLDKNKLELVKDATESRSVGGERRSLP